MTSVAVTLARWAADLQPSQDDLELADRALLDTVAVTLAARDHRVTRLAAQLPMGARWAVAGHVLDFDDLHMPSTTHVSAVCVPAALAVSELAAGRPPRRTSCGPSWPTACAAWIPTPSRGPGRMPPASCGDFFRSRHGRAEPR